MDITIYLPDEIGERAKAAELNLSRMLRDAVTDELERRDAVSNTLADSTTHEVTVEDAEGRLYTGRITGAEIAYQDRNDVHVYLTDDERVLVYDGDAQKHWQLDDPEEQLRGWLDPAPYSDAMHALGMKPIIDL